MSRLIFALFGTAAATIAVSAPLDLSACAVAPPANKHVEIANESAIVIWDAPTRTQHFIRRATFKSAAADFGFLVPTPTVPVLAESSDGAFQELARITAPRVVHQSAPSGGCIGCGAKHAVSYTAGAVQIHAQAQVAGYDAAVLEADTSDALAAWLRDHGYEFSDALKSWADHYIQAKWIITAFKVARDAGDKPIVSPEAVRMSFQTDTPFFPYREPIVERSNSMPPPRLLRVYFIGEERMEGKLGSASWPGKTAWSGAISDTDQATLRAQLKLPEEALKTAWRLTEFEDHSSPRPGRDDVIFGRSSDQSTVERPPQILYTGTNKPNCIMCLASVALLGGLWRVRRWR